MALAGLAIAASAILTGCSIAPSGTATGGGTGGSGESGQTDGGTTTTDPGTDTSLDDYQGAPATFPTDVPIIDGDIAFGIDLGTGWTVVIPVDDLAAGYADASGKLTAAGFTAQVDSTSPEGSIGVFTNDTYQINVTASATADYGDAVTYVVVVRG